MSGHNRKGAGAFCNCRFIKADKLELRVVSPIWDRWEVDYRGSRFGDFERYWEACAALAAVQPGEIYPVNDEPETWLIF